MGATELRDALLSVGLDAVVEADPPGGWVTFDYTVEVGAHAGETVRIGLLGSDWPINPPGAVQVSPHIPAPVDGNMLESPLGARWVYWSRPYPDWACSGRTIEEYLAHLRLLFSQMVTAA
jgi:hypothetical protein